MERRKMSVAIIVALLLLAGVAWAEEEYTGHFEKKGSVALKFGTHIFPKSDMTDYWDLSPDIGFYPVQLAYEHKLGQKLGLELAVCYTQMKEKRDYVNSISRSSEVDLMNFAFSPSLKYNHRLNNSMILFVGAGPDIVNSRGKIEYAAYPGGIGVPGQVGVAILKEYDEDISEVTWGVHGLIGMEYFVYKEPARDGLYDWPLSIGLEYRYTYASFDDFDEDIARKVNADRATNGNSVRFSPSKLDVGGHTIAFMLKWRFL